MTTSGDEGKRSSKGGRPGAMTVAMQAVNVVPSGPKVLRIGVIQAGKIVEERIIRKRETVTVGAGERNHFVIGAAGFPSRFELFQMVGGDYVLNFSAGMTGRVGLPAGVQTLEQLRASGAARNAGSHHQVKLTDSSRGKVSIGDTTLLFQFVSPPPVQPRPQLPAAARGGLAKSIDWMFTAFVMFSFMTHFGLVVYLENADWPIEAGVAAIPDQYVDLIVVEEREPPPPSDDTAPTEVESEEGEEVKETKSTPEPAKGEPDAADKGDGRDRGDDGGGPQDATQVAEATARLAEESAARAEAMLVGALGTGGGGAFSDVVANGAVTGNAEEVLADAAGVGVASGSSAGGTLRTRAGGGGTGKTGDLGSLSAASGGNKGVSEGTGVTEKAVKGTAKWDDGDIIGGTGDFDERKVKDMLKSRIRAIQICYEQQLRRNPSLAGKVTVEFTIERSGSISKAVATQNTTNDQAVADCVLNVVRRFRFNPGPEDGSVTFAYPFVFAPQK